MLPQRRPTTSSPTTPARDTFTWPPSTDELDAIEVIVLDGPPAAPRTRTPPRKVDLAHWGLTLTSLAAIVVAVVLQFANWRDTSGTQVSVAPSPVALSPAAPAPTRGEAIDRPAPAFVPVRKARARVSARESRAGIDSPPLRLPESYVQPRLISSGDGGRVRGEVVLGVQVRANGRVGAVDVLSDKGDVDRNLERAAVAAVKQWRYRPALRDGVPTPARLKVIVKFS